MVDDGRGTRAVIERATDRAKHETPWTRVPNAGRDGGARCRGAPARDLVSAQRTQSTAIMVGMDNEDGRVRAVRVPKLGRRNLRSGGVWINAEGHRAGRGGLQRNTGDDEL